MSWSGRGWPEFDQSKRAAGIPRLSQLTELDFGSEDEITFRILAKVHAAIDSEFPELNAKAPNEFRRTEFARPSGDTLTEASGQAQQQFFSASQGDTDPHQELCLPTQDPLRVESSPHTSRWSNRTRMVVAAFVLALAAATIWWAF